MKSRIPFPVYFVSGILLLYVLLISFNAPLSITSLIFAVSPVLIIWMVLSVLKSKTFTGKDLEEGKEWGYADREEE